MNVGKEQEGTTVMARKQNGLILKMLAAVTAVCVMMTGLGIRSARVESVTEDGLEYVVIRDTVTVTGFDPGPRRRTEVRRAADAEAAAVAVMEAAEPDCGT